MTRRTTARRGPAALAAAALFLGPAGAASAHVTLDPPEAPPGSYVRVALRVPHGCAGGAATTGLAVEIPDGVFTAKPMPKPGWRLAIERRPLDAPSAAPGPHARRRDAGEAVVARIAWEGGRLPDDAYDEFVLLLQTPDAPGATLALPVTQRCEGGRVEAWTERPSPGQAAHDLARPAPAMRLTAPR